MAYGPDSVTITLYLQAVVGVGQSLTTVLYLVDEALGNALNGDRYRTYNSDQDAADDLTAGYITSAVRTALQDAFSQSPKPKEILVGRVDTGGGETYPDALDLVVADGANFYGVCTDETGSGDAASKVALSAAIEADAFRIYFMQDDDSDWLTSGYPAAYTAIENRERTVIYYHDIVTESFALCMACNRLTADPDVISAPWFASLAEVADYTTAITTSQKALALANEVNLGLEWQDAGFWVSTGINANNRPIDQIVTSDWFTTRLDERVTTFVQDMANRFQKIPVSVRGALMITGIIDALLAEGVAAGHFAETQNSSEQTLPRSWYEDITNADITAEQLRFGVEAVFETAAANFNISVYFSQTAS